MCADIDEGRLPSSACALRGERAGLRHWGLVEQRRKGVVEVASLCR